MTIPDKPLLVLARLDCDSAPLQWWQRVSLGLYELVDLSATKMLRQRVRAHRLRLPRLNRAYYVGDPLAINEIRLAKLKRDKHLRRDDLAERKPSQ